MEAKDASYLLEKYSRSQLEEFFMGLDSRPGLLYQESSIKAYAAAMRTLHEKIQSLELINFELNDKHRLIENDLKSERELTDRMSLQLNSFKSTEAILSQEVESLKEELKSYRSERCFLQEKLRQSENYVESEIFREKEQLMRELNEAVNEISRRKGLEERLERVEEEKIILQSELEREKWKNHEILEEMLGVRKELQEANRKYRDGMRELRGASAQAMLETERSSKREEAVDPDFGEKFLGKSQKSNSISQRLLDNKHQKKSSRKVATSRKCHKCLSPTESIKSRHSGAHLAHNGIADEKLSKLKSDMAILNGTLTKLLKASDSIHPGMNQLKSQLKRLSKTLPQKTPS